MIRKMVLALMLVGVSFVAASSSSSAPLECEPEPVNPCDVVCEDGADVCDCPCWTDRRVEQTTCDRWNSIVGCWYF